MEPARKECAKCHADLFAGACFCMQCGSPLDQPARLPSSVRLAAQRQPPPRKRVPSETEYSITVRRSDRR
jgi:hypothetical protein